MIKKDPLSELGNTNYEMYVTDKLELPVHSVINLTQFVPDTFPMEIKITEEKLTGMSEVYTLIHIK